MWAWPAPAAALGTAGLRVDGDKIRRQHPGLRRYITKLERPLFGVDSVVYPIWANLRHRRPSQGLADSA